MDSGPQVLVSTHGKHHTDDLLPSLEAGLFDDAWRIRQSSVQLLGDLLYTVGDYCMPHQIISVRLLLWLYAAPSH
jgi:hypothetical protein